MKRFLYYGKEFTAPDWAEWVATDQDQSVWVYECQPHAPPSSQGWGARRPAHAEVRVGETIADLAPDMWRRTLAKISDLVQVLPEVQVGKLAPHINNEVRLVLAGHKPLASIEKYKDKYGYALAISLANTGALTYEVVSDNEVVITLPRNKHLIQEWKELLCHGVKQWGLHGFHYRMGKLYGYTEEDIDLFIKSDVQCDCNKCRGGK